MRYLVTAEYTTQSNGTNSNAVVVEADCAIDALAKATNKMCGNPIPDPVAAHLVSDFPSDWIFKLRVFDRGDVTRDELKQWIAQKAADTTRSRRDLLIDILERWNARLFDRCDRSELVQMLSEARLNGFKGFKNLSEDELIDAIMDGPVTYAKDHYDEAKNEKPFGLDVMVDGDPELWRCDTAIC